MVECLRMIDVCGEKGLLRGGTMRGEDLRIPPEMRKGQALSLSEEIRSKVEVQA
jgi:hypothetical protein